MPAFVFIDARLEDIETLVSGLAPEVGYVILEPEQDGILQIAKALEGIADLDSIHILSHGSSGTLYLGSTVLTETNLDAYAPSLAAIGQSLTETGDLLLYGCEVAAGEEGQSFIQSLAQITQVDVSASIDRTGLDGDWLLEATIGAIEAAVPLAATTQQAYGHALATGLLLEGTSGNDSIVGGVDDDTISGLAGNDSLSGSFGDDSIDGGADFDTLVGGYGNDTLIGGSSVVSATGDFLIGGAGSDLLVGGDGGDSIYGWEQVGGSSPASSDGNDTLLGGKGNDFLSEDGGAGADLFDGGEGNDLLSHLDWSPVAGASWSDSLYGGLGNDELYWEFSLGAGAVAGNDVLDGGDGDDRLRILGGWRVSADDASVVSVSGGAGADRIEVGVASNTPTPGTAWLQVQADGQAGADVFVFVQSVPGGVGGLRADSLQRFSIVNFEAGAGGDVLDVYLFLEASAAAGYYTGGNPFNASLQFLRLAQSNADTLLQWDVDGTGSAYTWANLATLKNLDKSAITSENFTGRLIIGTPENDTLIGGLGNDTIQGLAGDDVLDGSIGADSMEGGPGNDTYYVDDDSDAVLETDGGGIGLGLALLADGGSLSGITDTVVAAIDYSLANVANVENLTLTGDVSATAEGVLPTLATGNELNNVITGNALDNTLTGTGGNDTLEGGSGFDTAQYSGAAGQYALLEYSGALYVADRAVQRDGVDRLQGIDRLQFLGDSSTLALPSTSAFTPLEYVASHADLIGAFGANAEAGFAHFADYGRFEGRTATFSGLAYVASYADLMSAFGANAEAGASHYIQWGRNEGRSASFDGLAYIASHSDLMNAFGANAEAGATHYIEYGRNEGRTVSFDALAYIASYGDLVNAFGANATAGASHFISYGKNEGRTAHFNAAQYLANYEDLQAAFGTDTRLATLHFIQYGYAEGRTDAFLDEPSPGVIAVSGSASAEIQRVGDKDLFAISLSAGTVYQFDLKGSSTGTGTLSDPYLRLLDEHQTVMAADDNGGRGNGGSSTNAQIVFAPQEGGTYYLSAQGAGGALGTYSLSASTLPGDYHIRSLLFDPIQRWNSELPLGSATTVTYSFPTTVPSETSANDVYFSNFQAFNTAQKTATLAVLAEVSQQTGVTFVQSSESAAQVRFWSANFGATFLGVTFPYEPLGTWLHADIALNSYYADNAAPAAGDNAFETLVHEIGHGLGLKHPGSYNAGGDPTEGPFLPTSQDSSRYTVMSYVESEPGQVHDAGLMVFDIAAVQYLYGGNPGVNAGGDSYMFPTGGGRRTLWDAGGEDRLDASAQTSSVTLDLRPGGISYSGNLGAGDAVIGRVAIAFGTAIENARGGSGADLIIGSAAGNEIDGGAGADRMVGGPGDDAFDADPTQRGGADTMIGGPGNDAYWIGDAGDVVIEDAGEGTDTVWVPYASASLGVWANVENLGVDGPNAAALTGTAGANALFGGSGNDTLDGGAGDDTLDGGSGADTVLLSGIASGHAFARSGSAAIASDSFAGRDGVDRLQDVEFVGFAGDGSTGAVMFLSQAATPLEYIASFADLIAAFGKDATAGLNHYLQYGAFEGRQADFSGLEYIASYADLINAFDANRDAGAAHYIDYGITEGRTEHFDAVQYLANYADLSAAFGSDTQLATVHFIQYGYAEGRTDQQLG